MSINAILGYFCKSGHLHHLSRRFHNLNAPAKRICLSLIANGMQPEMAIKTAKRGVTV